jgi:hypothetical protein
MFKSSSPFGRGPGRGAKAQYSDKVSDVLGFAKPSPLTLSQREREQEATNPKCSKSSS